MNSVIKYHYYTPLQNGRQFELFLAPVDPKIRRQHYVTNFSCSSCQELEVDFVLKGMMKWQNN